MTTDAQSAYQEIFDTIVPEAIDFFRAKTRDYSGGPAFMLLGTRGQFADINRKFWKLYAALWEGKPLEGEQPDEIVRDFIGHCFLTLYCLKHEADPMHTEDHRNGDAMLAPDIHITYEQMPLVALQHLAIQRGNDAHEVLNSTADVLVDLLKDGDRG